MTDFNASSTERDGLKIKVFGIELNKTATKSLAACFSAMGYRNHSYSKDAFEDFQNNNWAALFERIDNFDSFEDWPWPLMYREIDAQYTNARFILTVRKNPDAWYRSLCKMAVRMGPLNDFEKHIYGHNMPQAAREEHLRYYKKHNDEVRAYFAKRPDKLLEICFDEGVDMQSLSSFLDEPVIDMPTPHINRSVKVYAGDSLWIAQLNRVVFQTHWYTTKTIQRLWRRLFRTSG